MEMTNCPKCGKIFTRMSDPLCDKCIKDEEHLFEVVRSFVNENEGCSIDEVSRETGVSVKKIVKYLKDGRLEAAKGLSGALRCEQCGKKILRGKFCDTCVININQSVVDIYAEQRRSKGVGMHSSSKE